MTALRKKKPERRGKKLRRRKGERTKKNVKKTRRFPVNTRPRLLCCRSAHHLLRRRQTAHGCGGCRHFRHKLFPQRLLSMPGPAIPKIDATRFRHFRRAVLLRPAVL